MENKALESKNDLNTLANEVLKMYGIIPKDISIMQSGGLKTVWKITTDNAVLCLKRLKHSLDKAGFSVNAQIYINESGGNVPKVILDCQEQPIVIYNDQLFVLYQWIPGRDLNFSNTDHLSLAVEGLAEFHIASKGYKPPQDAKVSSKLGKWFEQYTSMKNRLLKWKKTAGPKLELPAYNSYFNSTDSIIDIANLALEFLEKSSYKYYVENSNSIVLCHQDYGKGNAILTDNGVIVIDLDGVTFDLPARDLRKIIGKTCENMGQWDIKTINNILSWYSQVNPLSKQEKEIIYIDLLFPHWFFGLVKNLFQKNKQIKAREIEEILKFEQSKVLILKRLLKRGAKA